MCGGVPISWCSKKESIVALSSCEAEYITASMSACQDVWLNTLMQEIKVKNSREVKLFVDNKSAINLAKHLVAHGRSKHIETRFHFLRDQVNKGKLILEYCKTELQVAKIFTKALKGEKFRDLRDVLGVISLSHSN